MEVGENSTRGFMEITRFTYILGFLKEDLVTQVISPLRREFREVWREKGGEAVRITNLHFN